MLPPMATFDGLIYLHLSDFFFVQSWKTYHANLAAEIGNKSTNKNQQQPENKPKN